MSNFDKLKKTVEQLKLVTAGRHPQSPGQATKPAADPGKPKDTPHIRADSQTEVNFKLEKAEELEKGQQGRDDICAPNAKPKLTDPVKKSLPKREWVQRLVKAVGDPKKKPSPIVPTVPKEPGMVSQIKPKTGKLAQEAEKGIMAGKNLPLQPYAQRFPHHAMGAQGSFMGIDNVKSEPVTGGLWHHHGQIDENHTMHTLSREKNPTMKPLAGIITGKKGKTNFIRAAMSNVMGDESLSLLKAKMMLDPKHHFQEPIELDAKKHAEDGWEGHNPHLIHGLVPDKTLQVPPTSVSSWISFAGVKGDETPRVIAKEAIEKFPTKDGGTREVENTKDDSYLAHPKFNSAHREAAYSKLADEFFHLGEYVPKATVFKHPLSGKTWSAAEFIPGATPITPESQAEDLKHLSDNGDIYKMAIMNGILANNDRHGNNLLKDASGKVHLIDHGLAFDYNHITTDILPWYIHSENKKTGSVDHSRLDDTVPESVHQWISDLDPMELQSQLSKMGAPHDTVNMAVKRLADVKSWSKAQHFGSPLYSEGMHRGLRHLMDVLVSNRFDTDENEHKENAMRAMDKMQSGGKPIMGTTQPNMGTKTEIKANVRHPDELAGDDKPKAVVDPRTGEYSIEHPKDELTQRHPSDMEGLASKRNRAQ